MVYFAMRQDYAPFDMSLSNRHSGGQPCRGGTGTEAEYETLLCGSRRLADIGRKRQFTLCQKANRRTSLSLRER